MSSTLNSGLKIFDIIEILNKNPQSREEICIELKEKDINAFKRTVTKYIRTLRAAGFEIRFEDKIFQICKTPFGIELNHKEASGFYTMLTVGNRFLRGNIKNRLELLEYKLSNLIETQIPENSTEPKLEDCNFYMTDEVSQNIKIINDFIGENPILIKMTYKKRGITIIPKSIKYKKNGVFLDCYNKTNKKEQTLKMEFVSNMKVIGELKESFFAPYSETVFKISGRLKNNYILKEGEKARYDEDNAVYVTNVFENKEELFNRLVKYGKYCEVIYPESDRKKFIRKVKNLIKHYSSM